MTKDFEIVIVGLGYVGLGLAVEFGKHVPTIGYDSNSERINKLKVYFDGNGELESEAIKEAVKLNLTSHLKPSNNLRRCYIVTVPTPIDDIRKPDLSFLQKASEEIGILLRKEDVVIYESTTFPTCTRSFCIPILEKISGLEYEKDFSVAYCPERVNPGKGGKPLIEIIRVVASSSQEATAFVESLYGLIGQKVFKVESFEIAEMSKLAENCQRDLNISFVNELALICDKLEIDTRKVLEAASTKWNFQSFSPGLVGGHCISVDPYYLIYKAESMNYFPKLIGAGREVNESMPAFIASKCIKLMLQKGIRLEGAKALVLGLTFKENCSDTRNSKVFELIKELEDYNIKVDTYDPYLYEKLTVNNFESYGLIILAVPHNELLNLDFTSKRKEAVLFDVKGVLDSEYVDGSL